MPDDHSPLEPRLPISNRTVKRRRADDSADYLCESRSSSGTLQSKTARLLGAVLYGSRSYQADAAESRIARNPRQSASLGFPGDWFWMRMTQGWAIRPDFART